LNEELPVLTDRVGILSTLVPYFFSSVGRQNLILLPFIITIVVLFFTTMNAASRVHVRLLPQFPYMGSRSVIVLLFSVTDLGDRGRVVQLGLASTAVWTDPPHEF